jgi:cysteine desulfurase / selenocysteine lyase
MAENNICIRAGKHCAHPFLNILKIKQASRMSLYIYNTFEDIDKFFEVLDKVRNT